MLSRESSSNLEFSSSLESSSGLLEQEFSKRGIESFASSASSTIGVDVLKLKVNVLPYPSSDVTVILPLKASQMFLQMLRPNPIPLVLFSEEN